ncbi:MAG: hypothetical protein ACI8XZ_003036, partial [Gammaproteobacteria bacterium]
SPRWQASASDKIRNLYSVVNWRRVRFSNAASGITCCSGNAGLGFGIF